jgi:putative flippase GtrA
LSYLLNLAVLSACLRVLPPVPSQIIAITVFAIANYVGQSRFAFGSS